MIHTLWDIDDYREREREGETSTSRAGSVYGFFLQCVDVCAGRLYRLFHNEFIGSVVKGGPIDLGDCITLCV